MNEEEQTMKKKLLAFTLGLAVLGGSTVAVFASSNSTEEVTTPNCCTQKAACCVEKAPCCK